VLLDESETKTSSLQVYIEGDPDKGKQDKELFILRDLNCEMPYMKLCSMIKQM
jgi:hypothetical protein